MESPSSRLDLNPTPASIPGAAAAAAINASTLNAVDDHHRQTHADHHHHIAAASHSFGDGDDATAFITRAAANLLTGSLTGYSSSANYDGLSTMAAMSGDADAAGNDFSGSGDEYIAGMMVTATTTHSNGSSVVEILSHIDGDAQQPNNYWALLALVLVVGTAAGNILVCLAITRERRLQNITNYFLMSLAITDLMVAILVMPLGILTLVKGRCSGYRENFEHGIPIITRVRWAQISSEGWVGVLRVVFCVCGWCGNGNLAWNAVAKWVKNGTQRHGIL